MRLLFVAPYVPSRIRIRPYEFIRVLARTHHVEVVCLVSSAAEAADVAALLEVCAAVHPNPLPPMRAMPRTVWGALRGLPAQAAYAISPDLREAVEGMVHRFDLVHVEHLRGAATDFDTKGVPVVWDSVDCISLLLEEMGRAPQHAQVRALRSFDLARTRQHEARMLRRFSHVAVTSARDAAALWDLRTDASTTIAIVPNGVDLTYFRPQPELRERYTVIFTGKMSYHANYTAVRAFVRDVWVYLHSALPEARFLIVGSDPPRDIRDLDGGNGITVTGRVPDMRPYLARAAVAVAPLVYGVGNPNKVLEAMAMGLPVVATPPAVLSVCATAESGIITTERRAMIPELVDLLKRPDRTAALGANARRYVEMHHTWARSVAQLEDVYRAANPRWVGDPRWAAVAAD